MDFLVVGIFWLIALLQFFTVFIIGHWLKFDMNTKLLYGAASPILFILLGFPFKLMGILNIYVIFQFLIFFFILIFIIFNLKIIIRRLLVVEKRILYGIPLMAFYLIHFFSYESRKHISYGFLDMSGTHKWIVDIIFFGGSSYQSGIAIYLAPLYYLIDPSGSLDFLGFSVGLVFFTLTSLILELIRKNLSIYFLVFFTLQIFVENQKFLIGLSNNQFFIIYIPLILILIYQIRNRIRLFDPKVLLLLLVVLSIGIINPSLTLYIGYLLIFFTIILPLIFNYRFVILFVINFCFILGIVLFLVDTRIKFFNVPLFLGQYTYSITPTATTSTSPTVDALADYIRQAINVLMEIFKFKFIENPLNSFFSFGGYIAVLLMIIICIYSLIKKHILYFLFSSAGLIFGISTLTGIGQYSFIMGRVGWYFILITLILVSIIVQNFTLKKIQSNLLLIIVGSTLITFNSFHPPVEYRFDNEEIHFKLNELFSSFGDTFYLYSTLQDNRIYDLKYSNVNVTDYENFFKNIYDNYETTILVAAINKDKEFLDPVLSRKINKEDINNPQVLDEFYQNQTILLNRNLDLEQDLLQAGFLVYFDNESSVILIKNQRLLN